MPFPLIPVIGAASQLIGGAMNNAATSSNNDAMRSWSEHMYDRQRSDALTDRDFQNAYNSPAAQMARLKAAGLNPNLVYGNGAVQQPSAAPRPASVESYNPAPKKYDQIPGALFSYFDTQIKQAQTDLLKEQLETQNETQKQIAANTLATIANTTKTGVETDRGRLALFKDQALMPNTLDTARENFKRVMLQNEQIKANTGYTLQQTELTRLTTAQSLAKGVEEILYLRSQRETNATTRQRMLQEIENLKKDGTLKDLEVALMRKGFTKSDGQVPKMVGDLLEGFGLEGNTIGQKVRDFITAPINKGAFKTLGEAPGKFLEWKKKHATR